MTTLVDSHCHLFDMKNYVLPTDIFPVVVGYSPSSNRKAAETAKKNGYPFVIGIAPQTAIREDLSKFEEWLGFIREQRPNAIGEVGLDYKWAQTKADVEKERLVFGKMIALAREMDLPLVIHSRNNPNQGEEKGEVPKNAINDILPLVKGMRFVMHFYSGDAEQAARIVTQGGYISLTHMRSKEKRKIIDSVPLERLLVESDAPYVGRTPEVIRDAVAYIAEVKGLDADSVARQTALNAAKFFGFKIQ